MHIWHILLSVEFLFSCIWKVTRSSAIVDGLRISGTLHITSKYKCKKRNLLSHRLTAGYGRWKQQK